MDEQTFQACLTAERCRSGSRNIGEAEDIVLLADYIKKHSPKVQDIRLKKDGNALHMVSVRKVLTTLADCLTFAEDEDEAHELLATVASYIGFLQSGDTSSVLWKQATSKVENQYSLERIGMQWKE